MQLMAWFVQLDLGDALAKASPRKARRPRRASWHLRNASGVCR
jgi:hypothetical protein